MITFFTTAKKFEGHNKDSQINAIRSWLKLHSSVEIIIFEKPIGFQFLPQDTRIRIIDNPELEFGIPRIDYMFDYAANNAKNKLCCYINADIILTNRFIVAIEKVISQLDKKFLIVGQRYDFNNQSGEWDFSGNWETKYLDQNLMNLHRPTGSDYFLFPAKQYNKSLMCPLIVGRAGWDLWMIYDARMKGYKTIDLSEAYKVYHQNHDYLHKKVVYDNVLNEPESQRNLSFLPAEGKFIFTLYACDYMIDRSFKIRRNYSRGNKIKYLQVQKLLKKNIFLSKLKFHLFAESIN